MGDGRSEWEEKFRSLRAQGQMPSKSFAAGMLWKPKSLPISKAPATIETTVETLAVPSEKERALKSLQDFALKETSKSGVMKFSGGELEVKNDNSDSHALVINQKVLSKQLLEGKEVRPSPLLCAFIGHRLGDEWDSYDINEESEAMLSRMIQAMKLEAHEYVLAPFKRSLVNPQEDAYWNSLLSELVKARPRIVFLMGANVTASFIGRKERISKLHGQVIRKEFKFGIESITLDLMPIFHPEYLLINTAMKKAAWEDFQKAMEIMRG